MYTSNLNISPTVNDLGLLYLEQEVVVTHFLRYKLVLMALRTRLLAARGAVDVICSTSSPYPQHLPRKVQKGQVRERSSGFSEAVQMQCRTAQYNAKDVWDALG